MKFDNPETQIMWDELTQNVRDTFKVDRCLTGGRHDMTLTQIEAKIAKLKRKAAKVDEKQQERVSRQARVEMYRQQINANPEGLEYDVCEDRLIAKQVAFLKMVVLFIMRYLST